MKKILVFFMLTAFWCNISLADKIIGKGELKFDDFMINYFMKYLNTPAGQSPLFFFVAVGDKGELFEMYRYCPEGNCSDASLKNLQKQ